MSEKKIIYFIDGFAPSDDERLEAQSFGIKTVFRNSQYIYDAREECDAVAGLKIPEPYAGFPRAEDLVDSIAADMAAAKKRMQERRVAAASDTPTEQQNSGSGDENKGNTPAWGANQ